MLMRIAIHVYGRGKITVVESRNRVENKVFLQVDSFREEKEISL